MTGLMSRPKVAFLCAHVIVFVLSGIDLNIFLADCSVSTGRVLLKDNIYITVSMVGLSTTNIRMAVKPICVPVSLFKNMNI